MLAAAALPPQAVAQQPSSAAPAAAAAAPAATAAPKPHKHKAAAVQAAPARAAPAAGAKPALLGQYGDWGAYAAAPGGKKVCFAIARPTSSESNPPNRPRNPSYMFVSSRPADKVSNELSIIIGYPFKPSAEATLEIGSTSFPLYTQQDGAWIKDASEQGRLVDAMRAGQNAVVKGISARGTRTTDTFSLRGFAQAVDRTDQDCK